MNGWNIHPIPYGDIGYELFKMGWDFHMNDNMCHLVINIYAIILEIKGDSMIPSGEG